MWLDSLTNIDYANRIPRGRTYANTGKVFDVEIDTEHGQIRAKVEGNYHPFYRVTLRFEQVPKNAKDAFVSDLVKNVSIVSKLTNRELDPGLLELALKHNIKLFPRSWQDIGMKCNCPDFAVPCKHIAAVIYIVSEIIDSNPFIVFDLKGIDLLKEIEERGMNMDEATKVETASIEKLSAASLTSFDRICAQSLEYDLHLEPVVIERTVPIDDVSDIIPGSYLEADKLFDVDALALKYVKSHPGEFASLNQAAKLADAAVNKDFSELEDLASHSYRSGAKSNLSQQGKAANATTAVTRAATKAVVNANAVSNAAHVAANEADNVADNPANAVSTSKVAKGAKVAVKANASENTADVSGAAGDKTLASGKKRSDKSTGVQAERKLEPANEPIQAVVEAKTKVKSKTRDDFEASLASELKAEVTGKSKSKQIKLPKKHKHKYKPREMSVDEIDLAVDELKNHCWDEEFTKPGYWNQRAFVRNHSQFVRFNRVKEPAPSAAPSAPQSAQTASQVQPQAQAPSQAQAQKVQYQPKAQSQDASAGDDSQAKGAAKGLMTQNTVNAANTAHAANTTLANTATEATAAQTTTANAKGKSKTAQDASKVNKSTADAQSSAKVAKGAAKAVKAANKANKGTGAQQLADGIYQILSADLELANRKKKPGRKSKAQLEEEQKLQELKDKYGSVNVGLAIDKIESLTGVSVFKDQPFEAIAPVKDESSSATAAAATLTATTTANSGSKGRKRRS